MIRGEPNWLSCSHQNDLNWSNIPSRSLPNAFVNPAEPGKEPIKDELLMFFEPTHVLCQVMVSFSGTFQQNPHDRKPWFFSGSVTERRSKAREVSLHTPGLRWDLQEP